MRVAGDVSTGSTSSEGDSAMPDARTEASALGRGTPLLSQLLQQEPGPPAPHPPSSSSSESDEGGPPGTGLWYEGEWWPYDDIGGNGDGAAHGTAGGATGGMYEEGE